MDIFEKFVVLRWMENSKIVAVSWCCGHLIIGTDGGNLYSFESRGLAQPVESNHFKLIKVCNKRILHICSLEPREELLVLNADGDLLALDLSFKSPPTTLCQGVACLTRQVVTSPTRVDSPLIVAVTQVANICVATRNKLIIYSATGMSITKNKEISIPETPKSVVWYGDCIVLGCNSGYFVTDREGTFLHDLCATDPSATPTSPKLAPSILATSCLDMDVMVLCQSTGVFYNMDNLNLAQKNTIQWSDRLEALGCCPPFVVGLTCQRFLEVYGIRNQKLYQRIEQPNVRSIYFLADKNAILAATPNLVTCIKPCSYYEHLQGTMIANKSEALQLANLYFAPDDARRMREMKAAHTIAGWIKFQELNFPAAFQHFSFGTVDVLHMLQYWPSYYKLELPCKDFKYHRNFPIPLVPLIPTPTDLSIHIKQREPNSTKCRQLVSVANGCFATFLLGHIFSEHWSPEAETDGDAQLARGLATAMETVALVLLAEANDVRLTRLLQIPLEKSNINLSVAKAHLSSIHKEEIYARLLIRLQKFTEAMDIISNVIKTSGPTDADTAEVESHCLELASCINTVLEFFTQAQFQNKDDSNAGDAAASEFGNQDQVEKMLRSYLPLLIAKSPQAALDVLCRNYAAIPLDTRVILELLEKHSTGKDAQVSNKIKYLEDLVIVHKAGSILENTLLVQHHVQMHELAIASTSGSNRDLANDHKLRLLKILEGSYSFDLMELKRILTPLDCLETHIVLLNKLGEHYKALELIFTNKWTCESLIICEAYCQCFGDVVEYDEFNPSSPYKRLFTNLSLWIEKAQEVPVDSSIYSIDENSSTSIDKLLMALLRVLVLYSDASTTRTFLSKYMPFNSQKGCFNGLNVLELLPDDWEFAPFVNVLLRFHQCALHQERLASMQRGLNRSLYSKTRSQVSQMTDVAPIMLDATTTCAACMESIKIGMSIALARPQANGQTPIVMHEHCAQKHYRPPIH